MAKTPVKKAAPKKRTPINPNTVGGRVRLQEGQNAKSLDRQIKYNRPNQTNPFGSEQWTTGPDGKPLKTTSLSPEQQALLDQQTGRDTGLGIIAQGQLGALGASSSHPFDLSGLGNDPRNFDYSKARGAAEDRVYGRFAARNEPRFEKESKDFDQQMAAQGIAQGTDQYKELKQNMTRNQQDQRDSAGAQAFQLGGSEEAQAYGQGLQSRQQGVSEYGQTRNAPYQDMANVLSLQKGVMLPNFSNAPALDTGTVDAGGYASQIAQEANQRLAASKSGGGGGGAAAAPFSLATDPSYQRQLALMQAQQGITQANQPSTGQQVLGAIGPGVGQGVGTWIGKQISSLWGG